MRDSKGERMRGTSAQAILDRGWARPPKLVEVVAGAEGRYLDVLRVVNEGIPSKRNKTQT